MTHVDDNMEKAYFGPHDEAQAIAKPLNRFKMLYLKEPDYKSAVEEKYFRSSITVRFFRKMCEKQKKKVAPSLCTNLRYTRNNR